MYKMIILDLDGTLLNDYKEISKENINLIKRGMNETIRTAQRYGV